MSKGLLPELTCIKLAHMVTTGVLEASNGHISVTA